MKKIFTLLFLAAISLGLFAEKRVSGVVLYENGEPVIGASIQAQGTTQGTISDYDGQFEMEVPESVKTLVVSFVGMATQEVNAGKNLRIVLKENTEVIQEVVVTGYGNVSKGSFAGSAQAVDAENIEKKSPTEVSKALAGEVAGVQVVTTTGQPGEAASIRIRGIGSLYGGSNPLYIVDGVPYDGDYIATIDPGDIASTTILKDATATSLYGSRGANGVIVITTKKGTSGEEGRIDVDIKYGANMRLLPMYDVITDPQEYVEMAWMSLYNTSSRALDYKKIQDANDMLFGPKGIPLQYLLWQVEGISNDKAGSLLIDNNGKFKTAADGVTYKPGMDNLPSWRDAIFRTGQKVDATVKISGGTGKTTYFVSGGYLRDEGYYIGSSYDRFTIRSNVDFEPKKWLKGNVNMAYTYSTQDAAGQGDNMNNGFAYVNQIAPIFPVYLYNEDGTIQTDPKTGGYAYDYGMFEGAGRAYGAGINPAGSLRYDRDNRVQHFVMAGGSLEFKLYKGLKLTVNANVQYSGLTQSEYTNAYYGDAAGIGRTAKMQANQIWFTSNQLLEYNSVFGEHNIRVMAGHESQMAVTSVSYGGKSHVAATEGDNVLEWGNAVQISYLTSYKNSTALESYLATASYIYNERYGITANYRADGSSKFAKGHRWGHFGSVGGSWMFTNEHFMEGTPAYMTGMKGGFQTDFYFCSGENEEFFEPRFTYNGYQYIEVVGLREAPKAEDFEGRMISSDFPEISSFTCSNELLNKIQAATVRSYHNNFVAGYPTDCPHREKNGWTGDAQLACELAQYNFENTAGYEKWLDDICDEQKPSGDICAIIPTGDWGYPWGNGPAWDASLVLIPWYVYMYRGDRGIIEDSYDSIKKYVDFTSTRELDNGLVSHGLGDWVFAKTNTPVEVTSTGYYYLDVKILAQAARMLGKEADYEKYSALANKIRSNYNAALYKGDGVYSINSQTSESCAIHQGFTQVLDKADQDAVFARLVENVAKADGHFDVGILGAKYILRTLSEGGRNDLALQLILQETKPAYADWIRRGAGTLWEDWNEGSSRNHIMFGDVSAWFYQSLAGIKLAQAPEVVVAECDPQTVAFKRTVIEPKCSLPRKRS